MITCIFYCCLLFLLGGNRNYTNHNGKQIGVEHFGSTLHFGPSWDQNGYWSSTFSTHSEPGQGFNNGFHKFQMEWTPECIRFCVDYREVGTVQVGDGFWSRANFKGEKIWKDGTSSAPFDQEVNQNCPLNPS